MAARPEQLLQHIRRLVSAPTASPGADADLLDRFIHHRDEASFAALVQRHGPMVLGVCRRILGNLHDAEDAFQAAFLVLARKANSVKPRHALTAWLYGVARRVALKARTARTRQCRAMRAIPSPAVDPHASPLDDLSARELLAVFDEELQRLPRTYRLPLILCCIEGRSQEEAARQLGWTAGSVKGRLERGRLRLRDRLLRRGLVLSAALMTVEATRTRLVAALAEATVGASLRFVAGSGGSGAAALLAEAALRGMAWSRAAVWAVLLSTVVSVAGTGTFVFQAKPKETEQAKPTPVEQPQQAERRRDQYGDPLPPHAIARLGTLRFRGVRGCLAFSPDGKWLAAATGEAREYATIWEAASGRKVRRIECPVTLQRLAFSPDGKRLACSGDRDCRVVNVADGKKVFTVSGTQGTFSRDGKTLITTDVFVRSPRIRVWEAVRGKPLPQSYPGRFEQLVAADDDRTIAVRLSIQKFGEDAVQVVDLHKGEAICAFRVQSQQRVGVGLAPDGKTLATADASSVRLWDVARGKEIRSWDSASPSQPVFAPDGKRLAWIGFDKQKGGTWLWMVERDGGKPRAVGGTVGDVQPPCFSPDGKVLAAVTHDYIISLRDVASGKEVVSFDAHNAAVLAAAFHVDGRHVISRGENDLFVWQMESGKRLRHLPEDLPAGEKPLLNTVAHGRIITVQTADNTLHLRDLMTLKELRRLQGKDGFHSGTPWDISEVSPDGSSAAVLSPSGVRVYNLNNGAIRCQFTTEHPIWGMHFSEDGRTLIVTIQDFKKGLLTIFRDARTGREIKLTPVSQPRNDPQGRWRDRNDEAKVRLRHLKLLDKGGQLAFPGADGLITSVHESPDGRYLAVEGRTGPPHVIDRENQTSFLRIWDVKTQRIVMELDSKRGTEASGGFSPDGRTFVSTTHWAGTIHLWELATGRERLRLQGHLFGGSNFRVAFRADGRALVSGGGDSQAFVWDLTGRMPDGHWRTTSHSPEQRAAAWETLASTDAKAAYRAIWQLTADPDGTVAFLNKQVLPIARPDAKQVADWLAALDSAEFAERQRAERALEAHGETVAAAMRQTLTQKPSLEVRRRIEALLEKLHGVPQGRQLQARRGVEVLEYINTPEARTLLRKLAAGAAGASLTEEARRALQYCQTRRTP